MKITASLIRSARQLAVGEMEKYGLPHPINFEISEKKALELADKLGADKDIVILGAYFMDLKLGQASQEKRLSEHVSMGVDAAGEFLKEYNLDDQILKNILNCVGAHHGDIPFNSLEAEICANADCYRFIHPKGFFLWLTTLGKRGLNFYECLEQAEYKLEEKHNILSLDICKNELEPYYQTFKTYIGEVRKI